MITTSRIVALCATIAILPMTACSGGTSAHSSSITPQVLAVGQAHHLGAKMQPNCSPDVWASTLPPNGPPIVTGYSGGTVCVTVDGTGSGQPFVSPYGLATDAGGFLYVTDYGNDRVVVFDSSGTYYSTLNGVPGESPVSVCVSPNGVVAVTNRPHPNTAEISFYTSKGAFHTTSNRTGSATGILAGFLYCAFDRRGDFFTDGNTPGGSLKKLVYLRNSNVNQINKPLLACNLAICNSPSGVWTGMYSHIRPGNANVLSMGSQHGAPLIYNFVVTPGAGNQLNFATWATQPTTALTNYPLSDDELFEIAPSAGANNASSLYVADYYIGEVLQVPNATTGGLVSLFNYLPSPVGVATNPTGQY